MPTVRSWKFLDLTTRRAFGGCAGLELSVMRIKAGVGEMGKGRLREGQEPADRAPASLPALRVLPSHSDPEPRGQARAGGERAAGAPHPGPAPPGLAGADPHPPAGL